jgi:hypothetical protein
LFLPRPRGNLQSTNGELRATSPTQHPIWSPHAWWLLRSISRKGVFSATPWPLKRPSALLSESIVPTGLHKAPVPTLTPFHQSFFKTECYTHTAIHQPTHFNPEDGGSMCLTIQNMSSRNIRYWVFQRRISMVLYSPQILLLAKCSKELTRYP